MDLGIYLFLSVPMAFACYYSQPEVDPKDTIAARKVQKADREKLRRDRLNEQFIELGNALGNYFYLLTMHLNCAFSSILIAFDFISSL